MRLSENARIGAADLTDDTITYIRLKGNSNKVYSKLASSPFEGQGLRMLRGLNIEEW